MGDNSNETKACPGILTLSLLSFQQSGPATSRTVTLLRVGLRRKKKKNSRAQKTKKKKGKFLEKPAGSYPFTGLDFHPAASS